MRSRRIGQAGFSMIENLVALGAVSIVGMATLGASVAVQNMSMSSHYISASEKQVSEIVDRVRVSLETQQVNFSRPAGANPGANLELLNQALDLNTLPMAWDNDAQGVVEACGSCKGRYGYIVQPFENYPGLFQVTLRMTHPSWSETHRDYQFVVSAK